MSENQEKFELVASMKAGWSRNQIQSATRILIKPVAEPGVLELYNAKKTIHFRNIDRKEESIQINQYELRWRPLSTESESNEIKLPITEEYEFIRYNEAKDAVVFLFRKKEAWNDHFPYFFWSQEADSNVYGRFLSSFSLCLEMIQKDKLEIEKMNNTKLLDINEYMKERNVESIFDNEAICKKFYPYVSECLRSPEGLKRILRSPSFKKNIGIFQIVMDSLGSENAFAYYGMNLNDLPKDDTLEMGTKSYIKRIETWAKQELENEKKLFVC